MNAEPITPEAFYEWVDHLRQQDPDVRVDVGLVLEDIGRELRESGERLIRLREQMAGRL